MSPKAHPCRTLDSRSRFVAAKTNFQVPDMQNVNPWLEIAGMYANDPLYEEWQAAIEEYRDRVDRDIFGKTNNQSRRGTADDVDSHG